MRATEVQIESPCDEDLDRMRLDPDGLRRHCDRCEKAVHDLSAMGPERARALLAATRGPICISYVTDEEGELLFDDPRPVPPAASNFVPLARLAQAASLAATLSACTLNGEEEALRIEDSPTPIEAFETAPVVIPDREPPPIMPPERETDERVEPPPQPRRRPPPARSVVKGERIRTAGLVLDNSSNPLD